ncbi:hypothetical protein B0H17DRAFT_1328541 [Mycena rosella]|uniref:Uncharacterized protein n=1 Tax=Mycena rosella TaxID=1033263 RepID=A0AAD7GN17_MYCRO|nr:hypothetical protein B0H17DRAFT_1328541 [Mycena rosella]
MWNATCVNVPLVSPPLPQFPQYRILAEAVSFPLPGPVTITHTVTVTVALSATATSDISDEETLQSPNASSPFLGPISARSPDALAVELTQDASLDVRDSPPSRPRRRFHSVPKKTTPVLPPIPSTPRPIPQWTESEWTRRTIIALFLLTVAAVYCYSRSSSRTPTQAPVNAAPVAPLVGAPPAAPLPSRIPRLALKVDPPPVVPPPRATTLPLGLTPKCVFVKPAPSRANRAPMPPVASTVQDRGRLAPNLARRAATPPVPATSSGRLKRVASTAGLALARTTTGVPPPNDGHRLLLSRMPSATTVRLFPACFDALRPPPQRAESRLAGATKLAFQSGRAATPPVSEVSRIDRRTRALTGAPTVEPSSARAPTPSVADAVRDHGAPAPGLLRRASTPALAPPPQRAESRLAGATKLAFQSGQAATPPVPEVSRIARRTRAGNELTGVPTVEPSSARAPTPSVMLASTRLASQGTVLKRSLGSVRPTGSSRLAPTGAIQSLRVGLRNPVVDAPCPSVTGLLAQLVPPPSLATAAPTAAPLPPSTAVRETSLSELGERLPETRVRAVRRRHTSAPGEIVSPDREFRLPVTAGACWNRIPAQAERTGGQVDLFATLRPGEEVVLDRVQQEAHRRQLAACGNPTGAVEVLEAARFVLHRYPLARSSANAVLARAMGRTRKASRGKKTPRRWAQGRG